MRQIKIVVISIIGLSVPQPAWSKEKADPRIDAAIACASFAGDAQRLKCYDEAIKGLRQALETGHLIAANEATKPFALEGVVKASGATGFNRFWVLLDSGDRWELIGSPRDDAPRQGAKVRLKKKTMGNYSFIDPSGYDMEAKYKGRSPSP